MRPASAPVGVLAQQRNAAYSIHRIELPGPGRSLIEKKIGKAFPAEIAGNDLGPVGAPTGILLEQINTAVIGRVKLSQSIGCLIEEEVSNHGGSPCRVSLFC